MAIFVIVFLTMLIVTVWMAVFIGCYLLQEDKQIKRKQTMERTLEKVNAADLVSESDNAESHRKRKEKICDEFRDNTDAILADVLRRANKNLNIKDSDRGRKSNKPRL